MNFWHIQLHPGNSDTVDRKRAFELIHEHGVIGMSRQWENDKGQPAKFENDVSIGDVVLVRSGGSPLALVTVEGDCEINEDSSVWFDIKRPISILALNESGNIKDQYKKASGKNWTEGIYAPTTFEAANNWPFFKYWYEKITNNNLMENIKLSKKRKEDIITLWEQFKAEYDEQQRKEIQKEIDALQADWKVYRDKINDGNLSLDEYTNRKENVDNLPGGYLCNFLERTTKDMYGSSKPGTANNFMVKLNEDGQTYTLKNELGRNQGQTQHSEEEANKYYKESILPLLSQIVSSSDPKEIIQAIENSSYSAKQILRKVAVLNNHDQFLGIYKDEPINALHDEFVIGDESSNLEKNHQLRKITNELLNIDSTNQVESVLLKRFLWEYTTISVLPDIDSPNVILYGPPGTGKTYHTVNEALRITGVDISDLNRVEIKEEFDKKVREGQILFTTFHQSMSYEEFIEGIKPIEPEKDGGEVIYSVEPGLFKKISIEASFNTAKVRKSKETSEALNFSNLYDSFIEEVQEKLINEEEVKLTTKSGGTVLIDSISQQGNIIIKHYNGTRTYTVSKARLTKLHSAIDSLDSVSNINDEFREVIGGSNSSAYWSVLKAVTQTPKRVIGEIDEKTYNYNDKVEVVEKMTKEDFNTDEGGNFVLIIDEINRGNVSQIFGELITLIEKDKRLGRSEALEVRLPYSKEKFGVPPNLYIIGTMNTADRSVEALDTALRRRFSFTEMPPLYDIDEEIATLQYTFAGFTGSEILETINNRIEKLLDRDHLIGHSYFLMAKDDNPEPQLKNSFYRNIIPLLQEYFYGDYAKIGAVLGSGFVYKNEDDEVTFGDGFTEEDYNDKEIYEIIDYRKNDPLIIEGMTFEEAIRKLMNQ